MNTRILTFLLALVLGIGVCTLPSRAEEKKTEEKKTEEKKTEEKKTEEKKTEEKKTEEKKTEEKKTEEKKTEEKKTEEKKTEEKKTEEKKTEEKKTEEKKTEKAEESEKKEVAKAKSDTAKVKVSSSFLNRWKKIKQVTGKRAYETQQTRTVAGVRGSEAEDAVLDQLYYKGGVRYPSRVDLKNAITQLWESIKADPDAETVPEQKFFIAQCHAQLGETKEAKEVYNDIVKNHADTDSAKQAKEELKKMAEK